MDDHEIVDLYWQRDEHASKPPPPNTDPIV